MCVCLKKPGNIPLVMANLDSRTGRTSPLLLAVVLPKLSGLQGYWCSLYLHLPNPFCSYAFRSSPASEPCLFPTCCLFLKRVCGWVFWSYCSIKTHCFLLIVWSVRDLKLGRWGILQAGDAQSSRSHECSLCLVVNNSEAGSLTAWTDVVFRLQWSIHSVAAQHAVEGFLGISS